MLRKLLVLWFVLAFCSEAPAARIAGVVSESVPAATQAEAEAGTESGLRMFSPARIAQAVTALAPASSGASSDETPYGMIWDSTADTYRIGTLSNGAFVEEAVTEFPVQENMRRCLLADNGTVNYYLNANNSALRADGYTAADLTGADGQVMVEIPKFYFIQCQEGVYRYFFVALDTFSLTLPSGAVVLSNIHPAFYKGGSATPSDYRYVGAYEGSMYDASAGAMTAVNAIHTNIYAAGDKMCSVSGQYPKVTETIIEYREMAAARGTGWHQFDHALHAALSILYLTEYADFDSQTKIGMGRVSLSNGDWVASETFDGTNYGYIGKCGLSDSIGNATGANNEATNLTIAESPAYMSYRGVENWYGNVWKWLDGANVHNATATGSRLYLCINHTQYASDTATNYTLSGALPLADGYAGDLLDVVGVYPSALGGGSATFLADNYTTYYNDLADSGWKVAAVGGYAFSGTTAGAFFVSSNLSSANASMYFGGRLCY